MIRRASIPGRINIIGEHTDYAGGCSLAFASPHRLLLEADFNHPTIEGDDTVVALWREAGGPPAKLSVQSSIPIGKGMSSSAALCLAIALCVNGPKLEKQAACLEAQRLEHTVLGTPCGLLDQMAMMHAQADHCTLIDFTSLTTSSIPYPSTWMFKLIDTGIHRMLNTHDYRDTTTQEIKQQHVENENARVHQAMNASKEQLGQLLNESHASLRNIGVSTPEVDEQVRAIQKMKGVLGARMMGGGFGGMILVLVDDADALPEQDVLVASSPGFVEESL